MSVTIIGGGVIATEHAKALRALEVEFDFVVRSENTRKKLQDQFPDTRIQIGGLQQSSYLRENVIVAVNIDNLFPIVEKLINRSVPNILVEKPLSFFDDELLSLVGIKSSKITIAFNRLCFPSILTLRSLIKADGGIRTIRGEFTEAIWRIKEDSFSAMTLDHWLLANSTHVISTIFKITGCPKTYHTYASQNEGKGLKKSSKYGMIGTGSNNELIVLHADWGSPGSWCIEVTTKNAKYLLKPMERLLIQQQGSFDMFEASLLWQEPEGIKPGFYNQCRVWLKERSEGLVSVEEYLQHKSILKSFEEGSNSSSI